MARKASMGRDYFEDLYARSADPWRFVSSRYERLKYRDTLHAAGRGPGEALEIGCSIGVFTRLLAPRWRRLLAVDVSERAVAAARRRCADRSNVTFGVCRIPDQLPRRRFGLIVLSEVGYYWTPRELARFCRWLPGALQPGGRAVVVHWTGRTDYPLSGDEVHARLKRAVRRQLQSRLAQRRPGYRLDVLARR
jgi:SAM-dependent methyltransferase